jgi:SAM-dependent methyltransferase
MCNKACLAYGRQVLAEADVRGKRVIDVGARNVNGSLRPFVETLGPAAYVGVDIEPGPGVDEVVNAEDLVERFGPEEFDVVICTEVLEHVRDWRAVISNLKRLVAPGGVLLVTTRSIGFPYHAFPHDFWRFEPDDMRAIFSDFEVESVEPDPGAPGVFMTARRRPVLQETDLRDYELYSMARSGRVKELGRGEELWFTTQWRMRRFAAKHLPDAVKAKLRRSGSDGSSAATTT